MKTRIYARRFFSLAVVGLGATLFVAQPTIAQQGQKGARAHKRQGGPQQHLQKLAEQLNLTEEQKAAIVPILQDTHDKGKAVRENTNLTPEQKREQMKQIRKESHEKISAILTEEQRAKLKELRKQRAGQRGQRDGN